MSFRYVNRDGGPSLREEYGDGGGVVLGARGVSVVCAACGHGLVRRDPELHYDAAFAPLTCSLREDGRHVGRVPGCHDCESQVSWPGGPWEED